MKLAAFANYGFPESHAMSFAYLVYASAWFKRYHPAAFCAALINAQPMGFYSPQSLVDDARRHGVEVRRPDINASGADGHPGAAAPCRGGPRNGAGRAADASGGSAARWSGWACPRCARSATSWPSGSRPSATPAARTGTCATWPAASPATGKPLTTAQPGGAGHRGRVRRASGLSRREALWAAGAAAQERPDRLPGTTAGVRAPMLPGMDEVEEMVADVWATGLSPDSHPVQFVRDHLDRVGRGADRASCPRWSDGQRVLVGGMVTHRQRPATAGGITFLNLEDETGHAQRGLLAGSVAALPPGGADRVGAADPGPAGAGRRGGQPRRRPPGRA